MIWHIAKKEILTKIIDFRFIVCTLIVLVIIALSTYILGESYGERLQSYNAAVAAENKRLKEEIKVYSQYKPVVFRKPEVLSIICRGKDSHFTTSIKIDHGWIPRYESSDNRGWVPEFKGSGIASNPFANIFGTLDLIMVFQIVLSLLAVLFVYDAISGEREQGTLRLMLSNGFPRHKILLGKMIGNGICLAIPVFLGIMTSFLIILLFPLIQFTMDTWFRAVIIVLVSLLFLFFFVSLGIFTSSLVKRSSISLILLLFFWVITVIIQPNFNSYLVGHLVDVSPEETMNKAKSKIWKPFHNSIGNFYEDAIALDMGMSDANFYFAIGEYYCYDGNRATMEYGYKKVQELEPLRIECAEKEWSYYQNNFQIPRKKQLYYQNIFDYFCPGTLLSTTAKRLAGTDVSYFEKFMQNVRIYLKTHIQYLKSKNLFSENANLYFTRLTKEEMFENNNYGLRESYKGRDYQPLDLSDVPEFFDSRFTLIDDIQHVIFNFFLLFFFTLVAFLGAFVSFLKYDVR